MNRHAIARATLVAGITFAAPAFAANESFLDGAKVTVNTTYISKKFDKTAANAFELNGWITTVNASKSLNASWLIGAFLAGGSLNSRAATDASEKSVRNYSPGAYASWNDGDDLHVTGMLAIGSTGADATRGATGSRVGYSSNSRQVTTALSATKYFTLADELLADVGASYTQFFFSDRAYVDPVGGRVPGESGNWGLVSARAGLTYYLDDWRPFVSVDVNRGSREIVATSGSKGFFGYELGTSYSLTPATDVVLSHGGTQGVSGLRDRRYSIGLNYTF